VDDSGARASSFKLQRLLIFLLKYWWVPVLTLIVGLGVGVGVVLYQPPTFVSRASMWQTEKLRLPEGAMFAEDVQNFLGTQTELLQSDTMRQRALARLRTQKIPVPKGPDGQELPVAIRVAGSSKSSVFSVEATSSQAAYTTAYLNALVEVYLEYKQSTRKDVSDVTLESISKQLTITETELQAAQNRLTAFQTNEIQNKNLAVLQQEAAVAGGYLATLKTKLSDLELEARLLEAASLEKEEVGPGTNTESAVWVDSSPGTMSGTPAAAAAERQTAFQELQLLKIRRAKLSQYLRPKHPKIVKLDADIARVEKLMEIFRRQNRDQLEANRQANRLKKQTVEASISEWEAKVAKANASMAKAEALKLEVQRVQSVYDRLTLLMQNVRLGRNLDVENLAILEQASQPKRSYRQEASLMAMSGVGGLGLGLGLIVLIAIRDDRFMSLAEVTDKLGDNVVGQVPEVPQLRGKRPALLLEANDQPYIYAESYRSLRSAILFLAIEGERPKTLLITSALPAEGKSTIAVNLARTLALGGARVVLVDADLRKGILHELTGLQREPGLAELLLQPADLDKIIQDDSLPNLGLISRGGALSNPGDFFLAASLNQVLAELRQRFDYVIIDSSPVFASDDATTLAPKVDGTLFVVRRRFSSASQVREALSLLNQRQARVLGVIVNRTDTSARSYYYYKYADYYGTAEARGPKHT